MKRTLIVIAVWGLAILGGVPGSRSDAADPYLPRSWWPLGADCCCGPPFGLCCDDYCRKPPPRIPCRVERCVCDDYCRPPAPCVPRPTVTCIDDYDCKPLPRLCVPRSPPAVCIPYCAQVSDSPPLRLPTAGRPQTLRVR